MVILTSTVMANRKSRVCFSYAAYAKNLIAYLRSLSIPVEIGLSEEEFDAVEGAFCFTFPPDLRCILQEGLPLGPGFPNWRSSSKEQMGIQMNLPIFGICKRVSRNMFWVDSWGQKPDDSDQAVRLAEQFLRKLPILVPIFRHFYIPAAPYAAGNPVFHVYRGVVKLWSYDIGSFFQEIEFSARGKNEGAIVRRIKADQDRVFAAPAWVATVDRRVEFWTDVSERKENTVARGELNGLLEDMSRKLREGGWKEKDVREMMMDEDIAYEDGNLCRSPDSDLFRQHPRKMHGGWWLKNAVDSPYFLLDIHKEKKDDNSSSSGSSM